MCLWDAGSWAGPLIRCVTLKGHLTLNLSTACVFSSEGEERQAQKSGPAQSRGHTEGTLEAFPIPSLHFTECQMLQGLRSQAGPSPHRHMRTRRPQKYPQTEWQLQQLLRPGLWDLSQHDSSHLSQPVRQILRAGRDRGKAVPLTFSSKCKPWAGYTALFC